MDEPLPIQTQPSAIVLGPPLYYSAPQAPVYISQQSSQFPLQQIPLFIPQTSFIMSNTEAYQTYPIPQHDEVEE